MGKLLLLLSFLVVTPFVFALNILMLSYLSFQNNQPYLYVINDAQTNSVAYAALPPIQSIADEEITQVDARVETIRQFFAKYKSPLEPFAEDVVFYADQYELDHRLIPAIAMQESNLCKKIPDNSHNCWGYGIYGGKILRFDNYEEAIHQVTRTLARKYKTKGLETPEEIMTHYTPGSNGSWAKGVFFFMEQLQ